MTMATGPGRPATGLTYTARALALWPRLDPSRLRRAKDDPLRIARLVEGRTKSSREEILALLGVIPSI